MTADSVLQNSIEALAVAGVVIGHRIISAGDELALLPEEQGAFATSVEKVRRQSGAARLVARQLMAQMGQPPLDILKGPSGAPIWPDGLTGSLAHTAHIAVAALARRTDFSSIGVDVEPAEPLEPELLDLVATASEQQAIANDPLGGRLLFTIKEAVYKAVNPLDGVFLEHHDVEVNLAAGTAAVRGGRLVRFRHVSAGHIVVLAII
jgi:4'-phosphopantetheinyl transferase EntD